jgi:phage tail sheath protein FI
MATEYHHGARPDEVNGSPLSVTTISTAVIGMVCTAMDADAATFPLDTPVLITDAKAAIAKAGIKGTLSSSLNAISGLVRCPVVVVRVTEGVDDAATTANVIGTVNANGKYTGMQALLTAESSLKVRPRILGVPGLDTQAVTTAMVTVAKKLRGFVYAMCDDCLTISDCLAYREDFGARELMLIWPDFSYFDTTAAATAKAQTVAIALGLRAQLDQQVGWHKTLSNVPVDNVTGITKDVFFQFLGDGGSDADLLNAQGITTLINRNGFRFWGSRTCDEAQFTFESYTRTAQVITESMGESLFEYADKPASAGLIRDVVDGFNRKLRQFKRDGYLIGGKAWFDPSLNTPDEMKNGKFQISYDYTPVPPFEQITLQQTFTDTYFADLATAVATTNNA